MRFLLRVLTVILVSVFAIAAFLTVVFYMFLAMIVLGVYYPALFYSLVLLVAGTVVYVVVNMFRAPSAKYTATQGIK